MLWYDVVCYGMLWYVMICYGMLWYVMVCYGMCCCVVLCSIVLYCVGLCCDVLCCCVLCCVALRHVILSHTIKCYDSVHCVSLLCHPARAGARARAGDQVLGDSKHTLQKILLRGPDSKKQTHNSS